MEFEGPEAEDFANVRALNRDFLRLLTTGQLCPNLLPKLAAPLARRLGNLSELQIDTLSTAPFLLLSFRERDADFWGAIFESRGNRDLFAQTATPPDQHCRLIDAALGFIWQLAKRNPYAARLICGASLHWCEQIAEQTIARLLALTGSRPDVLSLRFEDDNELWRRLLQAGVSNDRVIREAAHLSALQAVLTQAAAGRRWPRAARTMRSKNLQIADDSDD